MPTGDTRTCLITGAAGGIGRALVETFRGAGYRVVATDRVDEPEGLMSDLYVKADLERFVEEEDYANTVFESARAAINGNKLHALVNSAAIQILGNADSLTRSDWRTTLDVNLIAPFLLTQGFLPELENASGSVVNVSSIHARLTKSNFVAYATSKAALSGMTRAMAVDMGPRVRVNAIEPAAIDTPMLWEGLGGNRDRAVQLAATHPVGRIGTVEDVACLTLALADGRMQFLSGASIDLSGALGSRLHDVF